MSNADIRVLIADDHDIVRAGLRMLLAAEDDIEIVGEAGNGREAVEMARALCPNVIVMDVQMPEMNGIEAARQIRAEELPCAVLALTIHEDEQYFFQMISAGAMGYVPKRAAPDDLVHAIRTVNAGSVFLYPSMAAMLVSDYVTRMNAGEPDAPTDALTDREREVLTLIAEGVSNRDIADRLTISVKTVERHRENIMNKLSLHSRTELVKYAIRKGLIDIE
ncbi:MAG: response regulator transcription factor [Anaerolineae bacterium]|nr:response regulator transcription factor [Anaerolineae bacterium]